MTFEEYWAKYGSELSDLSKEDLAREIWSDKSQYEGKYRSRYHILKDSILCKLQNEILKSDRDYYYSRTRELDKSADKPRISSDIRAKMTDRVSEFRDEIIQIFDSFEL